MGQLEDVNISEAIHQHEITELEQKLSGVRRERDSMRMMNRQLQAENESLQEKLDIITEITHTIPDPPEWLAPAPSGEHIGTPILLMTDNHFDEIVKPEQIHNLNAYNRAIAEMRLRKTFEGAVTLPQQYIGPSLRREGIVLAHAGDLITGEIHDELTETNEAKPPETIEYFLDPMIAGIRLLREEYGKVHVVAVPGNHDRLYKKKRAKGAARENWSWLFWKVIAREFKRHTTITFTIPEAHDTIFQVHDTRFLLHHGDDFRGGGGIAGPLTPLAIGHYRKSRKHADAVRYTGDISLNFDVILQGHIHHRNSIPGIITGGAAKGYDEYAAKGNFPFEPASQELIIVTPERGCTFQAPIYVEDPEDEGWGVPTR